MLIVHVSYQEPHLINCTTWGGVGLQVCLSNWEMCEQVDWQEGIMSTFATAGASPKARRADGSAFVERQRLSKQVLEDASIRCCIT